MIETGERLAKLSPDQLDLVLRRLQEKRGTAAVADRIGRRPGDGGPPPLSFSQRRLWFLAQLEPGSAAYNLPAALRLAGRLDLAALRRSLGEIVRRHEVLRTTFPAAADGEPRQAIAPPAPGPLALPLVDLAPLGQDRWPEALRLAWQEARRPFDLARGPLLRLVLVRLGEDEHALLVTIHHIVSDAWSTGIFLRELATLYAAAELTPLPIQYADFAVWQAQRLSGPALAAELAHWRQQLAGAPPLLELPTDRPRPAVQSDRGALCFRRLGAPAGAAVAAFSRRSGATPFMIFLAAFQALLSRSTHQLDISVGAPIAGRNRAEIEGLIGFFVNTLVLRAGLTGDPAFGELVRRAQELTLAAYAHQDLPFEKLVSELRPERDLGHSPLFQVMLALENAAGEPVRMPGLDVEILAVESGAAKLDLTLTLRETAAGWTAKAEYNRDLFDAATIHRLLDHYARLLAEGLARPDTTLSALPLAGAGERHQLLAEWNDTAAGFAGEPLLPRRLAAQAARTPDAVAVTCEGSSLTYAALDEQAGRLAARLCRLGVGTDVPVGICVERSLEMMVGLLGILKAGGGYVPLDPAYPPERLKAMLTDAVGGTAAAVLLVQPGLDRLFRDPATGELPLPAALVELEPELELEPAPEPATGGIQSPLPDSLAYAIYTSGSTGAPKGVMNTHRAICNRLLWMQEAYGLTPRDRVMQKTPLSFDVSVWELFWPLLDGACLVIARPGGHRDNAYLVRLIAEQEITVLHFVPSMLQLFVEEPGAGACRSLRDVMCSGEALSAPLAERTLALLPARLHNLYGPTEAAVDVTAWPCGRGTARQGMPIGRPIANCRIHLLDGALRQVPLGVAGELYIGGVNLARGYVGKPALTAARFVPDPSSRVPGERLYRTGDLARHLADGAIEYLGRTDHQVKVRGFRIELGEIEAALLHQPGVRDAAVVVDAMPGGHRRLVAYCAAAGEALNAAPDAENLRAALARSLPDYMVPALFVILPRMPLLPNGKVDRQSLPRPVIEDRRGSAPPQGPAEEALAAVWAAVLQVEGVGRDDNFFTLGGDSILSLRVIAQAREKGLELSVQQIFRHQTLRALAEQAAPAAAAAAQSATTPFSLVAAVDRPHIPAAMEDAYPLARLQAGMLFHSELSPETSVYHDIFSAEIHAPFAAEPLRQALAALIAAHPVLRTSFDLTSFSEPLQLVHRAVAVDLAVEDIRHLERGAQKQVLSAWMATERRRSFDWGRPPLLHFQAHPRSDRSFQFSLGFHHAILDGWSLSSLLAELFRAYLALRRGEEIPALPPPASSFRDFVHLEIAALGSAESRSYWLESLGRQTVSQLPRWRSGGASATAAATNTKIQLRVELPAPLSDALHRLAHTAGVPVKNVLLAAHLRVLAALSEQEEVVTGLVVNGRPEEAGAEQVLGLFLNTLPFSLRLTGGTWLDLVRQTLAAEAAMLAHRRFPISELHLAAGGRPLFEAVFNFIHFHLFQSLSHFDEIRSLDGEFFEETNFPFVVSFTQDPFTARLNLRLECAATEIPREQALSIAGGYQRTLAAMAAAPGERYEDFSLLTAAERHQMLVEWNDTAAECPQEPLVHELVALQARRRPTALAVSSRQRKLSYGELEAGAERLARVLRRLGVGPEVLVAICTERTLERVIGIVAVLKAGGAYVSLDTTYPRERLAFLLADAAAPVLLTERRFLDALPESGARVVCLDGDWEEAADLPEELPEDAGSGVTPANLAYVVYTSGSTGRPKGVAIPHAGLMNLVRWHQRQYAVTPWDRGTQVASPAFDASIWELWPYLTAGASVHIPDEETRLSSSGIVRWWEEESITLAYLMTPLAEGVLEERVPRALPVRALIIGGDLLHRGADPEAGFALMNHYGPAEYTVTSTVVRVPPQGEGAGLPSIGRPVDNTRIYVLDRRLEPVGVGVAGELFVGGVGLGRGYLGRPGQTAEKFVPDPFGEEPGGRLYRTADLVRYLGNGELEFLGRLDNQVKLRGLRIELGEIESVLGQHPGVREAAVLVREDRPGDKRLVAYVVGSSVEVGPEELRAFLRERLPEYMMPAAFLGLESLPLTPNGKVDRRALPAPAWSAQVAYEPPRNPVEERLAELFAEVLHLERIGIHENFFALGGHSLLATRLVSRVRQELRIELPLRVLFESPTIAAFAESVLARQVEAEEGEDLERLLAELEELTEEEADAQARGQG